MEVTLKCRVIVLLLALELCPCFRKNVIVIYAKLCLNIIASNILVYHVIIKMASPQRAPTGSVIIFSESCDIRL